MKIRESIMYFIMAISMAIISYNEFRISREISPKHNQTIQIQVKEEHDYLLPAPKEQVEKVIEEYYKEVSKTTTTEVKTITEVKVKVKPKKVSSKRIDITNQKIIDDIAEYIKKKEGFSASAYKDHRQYSIGYGTVAKSKDEKITIEEANIRLYKHIKQVIIPTLSGVNFRSIEQVYSAIDFSYNIGHNQFKKAVVKEDGNIDCSKMMAYNKVRDKNGNLVYNEYLAQRRLENFLACSSYEVIEE